MEKVSKNDILFRTTGKFGNPKTATVVGTYDVLSNGTVRWAVHSIDGGSAPLVDYRLGFDLFAHAKVAGNGVIKLANGDSVILRSEATAKALLDTVRTGA